MRTALALILVESPVAAVWTLACGTGVVIHPVPFLPPSLQRSDWYPAYLGVHRPNSGAITLSVERHKLLSFR